VVNIRHPFLDWSISVSLRYQLNIFDYDTNLKVMRVDDDFQIAMWPFSNVRKVTRRRIREDGGRVEFDSTEEATMIVFTCALAAFNE